MSPEHEPLPIVRTPEEERDYLLRRAEHHRLLAERSDEAGARSIHQRFQYLYQERADATVMVLPD